MNDDNENLKIHLEAIFEAFDLNVAVGLTKKGVAIRSQDERVDAQNIGAVTALSR